MSNKSIPTTPGTSSQSLKIGSRVRCTDDGVEGRIVWVNAVSLKIRWEDGEQVTWRRDSLADRPIEIFADDEGQAESPTASDDLAPANQTELPQAEREATSQSPPSDQPGMEQAFPPTTTEPAMIEQHSELAAEPTELSVNTVAETHPDADGPIAEVTQEQGAPKNPTPPEPAPRQLEVDAVEKQPRKRKPKAEDEGKEKRLSALDAAAKVLAESGQAMTCQELITEMAAKGYWTSPGGKTPAATLYSAMLRELTAKGAKSRFVKADRGKFALCGAL